MPTPRAVEKQHAQSSFNMKQRVISNFTNLLIVLNAERRLRPAKNMLEKCLVRWNRALRDLRVKMC